MGLILVATDFSQNCSNVLKKAIHLADKLQFDLKVVHVIEDGIFDFHDNSSKVRFNCMNFLNKNFPQIEENNFYIKSGSTQEEISKLSKKLDASLLVIGTSGEHFTFERMIMGSTTKKIIRSLDIPTLVIKNSEITDYKYILTPTDFSKESKDAIEASFKLFPESRINLLNVYSVPFESRLNMYGIDKEHANEYVSNIAKENLDEGNRFINSFTSNKNKLFLSIENDVLASEHFRDDSSHWLDGIDLVSLHTTGSISFFTFDMLEKSKKDVLIFKT